MITYIDGKWVEDQDATVNVRSRALNYGMGCFGGIRGYADDSGQVHVFRLHDHIRRFEDSCKILYLRLPGDHQFLCDLMLELLRRNEVRFDVYLRPLAIHNSNALAPVLDESSSTFIAFCMALKGYFKNQDPLLNVCVSSWRRVADNAIPARTKPTGAYLNSALARREAFDNGFDEAILLTQEGKVSEGSAEHVFLVRNGVLISPPSTADNLDGITRRSVIAMAEDLGIPFQEREVGRSELYVADEMFVCGTGVQITPVRSVDRRVVGAGEQGPITARVRDYFADVVHGRVDKRREWLTPVW